MRFSKLIKNLEKLKSKKSAPFFRTAQPHREQSPAELSAPEKDVADLQEEPREELIPSATPAESAKSASSEKTGEEAIIPETPAEDISSKKKESVNIKSEIDETSEEAVKKEERSFLIDEYSEEAPSFENEKIFESDSQGRLEAADREFDIKESLGPEMQQELEMKKANPAQQDRPPVESIGEEKIKKGVLEEGEAAAESARKEASYLTEEEKKIQEEVIRETEKVKKDLLDKILADLPKAEQEEQPEEEEKAPPPEPEKKPEAPKVVIEEKSRWKERLRIIRIKINKNAAEPLRIANIPFRKIDAQTRMTLGVAGIVIIFSIIMVAIFIYIRGAH